MSRMCRQSITGAWPGPRNVLARVAGIIWLTAVFCIAHSSLAFAQPKVLSQKEVATQFNRICLANFPDISRSGQIAKRQGMAKSGEDQWNRKDHAISVVLIPAGKRSRKAQIDLDALGIKTGWDFITVALSAKRGKGGCAMYASTPPANLYKQIANAAGKYGPVKARARAGGNAATLTAEINGAPAKITVKPVRLQGHRDFAFIMVEWP